MLHPPVVGHCRTWCILLNPACCHAAQRSRKAHLIVRMPDQPPRSPTSARACRTLPTRLEQPCPSENGSHLDAPLPRPVVAVEAHGSRHPCVAESPQRRSRLLSEPNLRDGATAQAFRRASVLIRRGNRRSASRTACLAAFIEQTGESRSGVASVGPLARSDRDR